MAKQMILQLWRIDVKKDYARRKIFTPVDITNQLVIPYIDVHRVDTTHSTSSITLISRREQPLKPFTKIKLTVTNKDGTPETIYRFVYVDRPTLLTYGTKKKWKHDVELIEPTKWLERFEVDNTTITNLLAFLYRDDSAYLSQVASYSTTRVDWYTTISYDNTYDGAVYSGNTRIYDHYAQNSTHNINVRLIPKVSGTGAIAAIPISRFSGTLPFESYIITRPDGTQIDASNLTSYQFTQLGTYTFTQTYRGQVKAGFPLTGSITARYRYVWYTTIMPVTSIEEKVPTRYNIRQVCDLVLGKIGYEATILRNGLDEPLFELEEDISTRLTDIISPEFTFTQNTLHGVLLQIGNEIQAVPRLIPRQNVINVLDEDGNIIDTFIDDWSEWNLITYDFIGGSEKAEIGEVTATENSIEGDNYTSSMVSNIQNSFQTNNADYISLTEPYENGFISPRTEDGNYEISNNHAVIKVSRPIQRIVEVICWVRYTSGGNTNEYKLDITPRIKENTDYSILQDYATNNTNFDGYNTKSSYIYFTRGSNIIAGLDYLPPNTFATDVYGNANRQAILNIISQMLSDYANINTSTVNLKDLMFKIKYVPFYNLKAKQYKALIDTYSGENDLFFNQNQQQSVDIESLGENMKGALMRTGNEEPQVTVYYPDLKRTVKGNQVAPGNFFAYQINKEITNKRVKATITLNKNWNKLNEYVAIKKNFREWEISERESLENNPNYNEFCVISHELDYETEALPDPNELAQYRAELAARKGFLGDNAIEQIFKRLNNDPTFQFKSINWVVGTTISQEYIGGGEYQEVRKSFIMPCACFTFGNSIVVNFGAMDNYAMATYARNRTGMYAVENFVQYGDRYGKVENMQLCFGSDNAKVNDFNTYSNALTTSKQFYGFDISQLNETAILLDYRANSFVANKDSRQQLNYTGQLHFVTDKEEIWIGKGLAQSFGFVGNTKNWNFQFATFNYKPDKFLSNPVDLSRVNIQAMPNCSIDATNKVITYARTPVNNSCVGYGIIDNQGRIVLYCDKEISAGQATDPIHFQFRRRI